MANKKGLAFMALFGVLIYYETPFFMFLGIPLINRTWDRALAREIIRIGVVMAIMVLIVLYIRGITGDMRLGIFEEVGYYEIFYRIIGGLLIGPVASLGLFIVGPGYMLLNISPLIAIIIISIIPIIYWGLHKLYAVTPSRRDEYSINISISVSLIRFKTHIKVDKNNFQLGKFMLIGLILLSLSYFISFTHFPPITKFGQSTAMHLASTVGGSMLIGSAITLVLRELAEYIKIRFITIFLISIYFSMLIGYSVSIQRELVISHQYQQWFWAEVLKSTADGRDGTVILVPTENLPKVRYVKTYSWATVFSYEEIFKFPKEWDSPPHVIPIYESNWFRDVTCDPSPNIQFLIWEFPLIDGNIIWLDFVDGSLVRREGTIDIICGSLSLKSSVSFSRPAWDLGILYDILIIEE
ncbi:MAG: hypothetical protein IH859_08880 [Chloroflexi bacterium]|nr:hypothetical protein [Chloroflexota bacterium]